MKKHPRFKTTLLASAISLACGNFAYAAEADSTSDEAEDKGQVVVVTASRRAQDITKVPYNISAIGGEDLKNAGISDLGELTQRIPGVAYTDRGARSGAFSTSIAMRGLSVEDGRVQSPLYTAPGVSTYVGDTPLFANIRFYDIDRVEVLRGPQGTLYGSGSLGGTLRFIPNLPDTADDEGELSTTLSQTDNGDGFNTELNGIFNFAISDTFAIRANIGRVDSAGWIDQAARFQLDGSGVPTTNGDILSGAPVLENVKGVNNEESTYGRIAALWELSDTTTATLAYNSQEDDAGGIPYRAVDYQDLGDYDSASRIAEPYSGDTELTSLDVEMDLGFATFTTSVSTYDSEQTFSSDGTGIYQGFGFYNYSYGVMPRAVISNESINEDSATIVEFRLVSQGDSKFDWVVGAFYMDQDTALSTADTFLGYSEWTDVCAANQGFDPDIADSQFDVDSFICGLGSNTSAFSLGMFIPGQQPEANAAGIPVLVDRNFISSSNANFTDKALFGELTWHLSDEWQVTGGLRAFEQTFDNTQVNGVMFFDQITVSQQSSDESDVLFKFNTSYQINDQSMVYMTRSEGFRRGGANALPSSVTLYGQAPTLTNPELLTYAPDEVTNLEIGIKGQVDQTRYSIAAFSIDWDKIQLNAQVTPFALAAVVNAGAAESNGFEAEINSMFDNGFDLTFGYSFVDATLTSPSAIGVSEVGIDPAAVSGRRLPGVPKHTASIDLNYVGEVGNWLAIYGVNANYRSDSLSQFDPATSTKTDGYAMLNASVTFESDDWGVRLFVNNLTNEEGVINTPHLYPNGFDPDANPDLRRNELLSRPRTIGVSFTYSY